MKKVLGISGCLLWSLIKLIQLLTSENNYQSTKKYLLNTPFDSGLQQVLENKRMDKRSF